MLFQHHGHCVFPYFRGISCSCFHNSIFSKYEASGKAGAVQFRIPADRLRTGSIYELLVEHAQMVDTKKADSSIIGLAAFPAVTKPSFRTIGPTNTDCPVQ